MTSDELAYLDAIGRRDTAATAQLEARIDATQAAGEARLAARDALRDAALWYAAQGVLVFPCAVGGKRPLTRHGLHDASTDLEQVAAWWTSTPDANIGLPTGHLFDVIDIDGPQGLIAFGEVVDAGGFDEPILARALTPRGRHYYVHPTGDGNRANLLPKVDYRGLGGYVIAAPSRTPDGVYRWVDDAHLEPATLQAAA